jgi:Gnt-I system low-affinity gluconate transporter
MAEIQPLLLMAASIVVLLFFILGLRIQAFLSLLIVALGLGIVAGMEPMTAIASVQSGIGGTLGYVATVVGLGAMFGALLEASGGVQSIAKSMVSRTSPRGTQWSLTLVGFLVSIPVFLDVALIILAPLLYGLARKTGKVVLYFGLPLLAGLMVSHTFIPPTPGPIAVADLLQADLAWVIMIGTLAGIPAMILAGPIWTSFALRFIGANSDGMRVKPLSDAAAAAASMDMAGDEQSSSGRDVASSAAILTILLPLALILLGATAKYWLPLGGLRTYLEFMGHPFLALITATVAVYYFFGIRRQMSRADLLKIMTKALEPAGVVVVITGAGGAFKQILVDSGMGASLAQAIGTDGMPIIFFAFIVTVIIRVAQGSATVAMITGAGLTAPVVQATIAAGMTYSQPQLALIVIAIASGASVLSHVNDSGFWLVCRYLGLTEAEALKTFTTMTTIVGLTGFAMVNVMWFLI